MKELDDLYKISGLITNTEVDCLYKLAQFNDYAGTIVEIGSWKGKSTIARAGRRESWQGKGVRD